MLIMRMRLIYRNDRGCQLVMEVEIPTEETLPAVQYSYLADEHSITELDVRLVRYAA